MRTSQCQVCGKQVSWRSLFDAKESTGVKVACVNCIERAARVEGAKAMQEQLSAIIKERQASLERESKLCDETGQVHHYQRILECAVLSRVVATLDPEQVVKGGGK